VSPISFAGVASDVRWQRLQQGRLKCDIDASFLQAWNRTCIDMCVRDDDGTFVIAKTMSFSPLWPAFVVEALGLFYADG
jgi:hypothetical protein